jgi:hypothetical protein
VVVRGSSAFTQSMIASRRIPPTAEAVGSLRVVV